MRRAGAWGWLLPQHAHRAREVFPDDPIFEVWPFVMVRTPQPTAGAMAYAQIIHSLPPLEWYGVGTLNQQQLSALQLPQTVAQPTATVQGFGGLAAGQIQRGPLINTQADAYQALQDRLATLGGAVFE